MNMANNTYFRVTCLRGRQEHAVLVALGRLPLCLLGAELGGGLGAVLGGGLGAGTQQG